MSVSTWAVKAESPSDESCRASQKKVSSQARWISSRCESHTHDLGVSEFLEGRVHALLHDLQLGVLVVEEHLVLALLVVELLEQVVDLHLLGPERVLELGELSVILLDEGRGVRRLVARGVVGSLVGEPKVALQSLHLVFVALQGEGKSQRMVRMSALG